METIITPSRNPNAIRHNLSQPEEVERVWQMLGSRYASMTGLSYGVAHRKTSLRVPDHYMFFASRNVPKQKKHSDLSNLL
ncbi:MAG: hypothetical protein Q7U94_08655 [Sideroxyarcus sp.]|nr:hypothetical protein [Sideroxyarcus sp.]